MKEFTAKDVPSEVAYVWVIQDSNHPIGLDTHKKCEEIIDKHPKWFPWEHKYKNIPQSVHDAFYNECYPDRFEYKLSDHKGDGKGLLASIRESSKEVHVVDFEATWHNYLNSWDKEAREKAKEEARARKIWNKHYKKFNLDYR